MENTKVLKNTDREGLVLKLRESFNLLRWDASEGLPGRKFVATENASACSPFPSLGSKGGKIVEAKEYWADTYPAPVWRKKWVKKI